jgi:hypothetical protein
MAGVSSLIGTEGYGFVKLVDTHINARVGREKLSTSGSARQNHDFPNDMQQSPRSGELFGRPAILPVESV